MIYEIILYILAYDIWFYISHILLHKNRFLKYIHKLHHSPYYKSMIYTDTYLAHYLETPIQSLGIITPLYFIEFNLNNFVCSIIFLNLRGVIRHDYRLIWLIGNHHILHHKYPQYNFGEYWLDYMFGTNLNNDECINGLLCI